MVIHSIEGAGVVSQLVPLLICAYRQDMRRTKTGILSIRPLRHKTCLIIQTTRCFTLSVHGTQIKVCRSTWDSYHCFFPLGNK